MKKQIISEEFNRMKKLAGVLNEKMAKEKMYEVTITHKTTKESVHEWVIATSEEEAREKVENSGMNLEDYYISKVEELHYTNRL
jgi:hypothetical protein